MNLWARNDRLKNFLIACAKKMGSRYRIVRVDTNNDCNLRCAMCPSIPMRGAEPRRVLGLRDFEVLAREVFPSTRALHLSCGYEPTMTPGFERYLEIAGSHGVPFVSYATNGQAVGDALIEATIAARIHEVTFSVDGAKAATYEAIRRGGNFNRLRENLSRFQKAKEQCRSKVPAIRFNFTVMPQNALEIASFVKEFRAYRPNTIQFRGLTEYPGLAASFSGLRGMSGVVQLQLQEARQLCRENRIRLIFDANGLRGQPGGKGSDLAAAKHESTKGEPPSRSPEEVWRLQKHFLSCPIRKICLYVRANGDYSICPRGGNMGNYIQQKGFGAMQEDPFEGHGLNDLCSLSCSARPVNLATMPD